jgi:glutamate synthase (NADH)
MHIFSILNTIIFLQSRLKPGRMLLVDTKEKRIIQDVQLKLDIARSRPHSDWLREQVYKNNVFQSLLKCYNNVIVYKN